MKHRNLLILITFALFAGAGAFAKPVLLTVHKVYSSHMVLQRGKPIFICGNASPGETVSGRFNGISRSCKADEKGAWRLEFPAMPAGGPYELFLQGDSGQTIMLNDVMIGEVWLCSGQSNMEMPLWSAGEFWRAANAAEESAKANYPDIRLFQTYRHAAAQAPEFDVSGSGWLVCSPETAAPFSAAGYFFAREIHKELQVPVGIINSSFSGTAIAPWISKEALTANGRQAELTLLAREIDPAGQQAAEAEQRQWHARFENYAPDATRKALAWSDPAFDDSAWRTMSFPAEYPELGVRHFHLDVELPPETAGRELILSLGAIDDFDEAYFNGVKIGSTGAETPSSWLVERCYPVPAELVKAGRNRIALRVLNTFRIAELRGNARNLLLIDEGSNQKISLNRPWRYQDEFIVDQTFPERPAPRFGANSHRVPSALYNGMIAPWCNFPVRGILWYQGEADASAPENYRELQRILIEDWRRKWGNPEMAFVITQLSAFVRATPQKRLPDDIWKEKQPGTWPEFREAQKSALALPHTGMAVTIDIGDHSDIHPRNKQTLGFRYAQEMKRICFGGSSASRGPVPETAGRNGGKVRIHFANAESGLKFDTLPAQTFELAGSDGIFHLAAVETDGSSVVLSSEKVPLPEMVRYAWRMYPGPGKLYNKEGFPASPFFKKISEKQ